MEFCNTCREQRTFERPIVVKQKSNLTVDINETPPDCKLTGVLIWSCRQTFRDLSFVGYRVYHTVDYSKKDGAECRDYIEFCIQTVDEKENRKWKVATLWRHVSTIAAKNGKGVLTPRKNSKNAAGIFKKNATQDAHLASKDKQGDLKLYIKLANWLQTSVCQVDIESNFIERFHFRTYSGVPRGKQHYCW